MEPIAWVILSIISAIVGLGMFFGKVPGLGRNFKFLLGAVFIGLAVWGLVAYLPGVDTASISLSGNDPVTQAGIGGLLLTMSDGLTNTSGTAVTTEDTIDDTDKFLVFYSADANIADGEEYQFNITVERLSVDSAGSIDVACTSPDKEIDGVTAKNIVEKTAGEIDLDFEGPLGSGSVAGLTSKAGKHTNGGNTVETRITFPEAVSSVEIQVKADQEETYHDGMTDLQDYAEITCVFSNADEGVSDSTRTRIYADS